MEMREEFMKLYQELNLFKNLKTITTSVLTKRELICLFLEASKLDHVENLEINISAIFRIDEFLCNYKLPCKLNNIKKVTFMCHREEEEKFLKKFSTKDLSYEVRIDRRFEFNQYTGEYFDNTSYLYSAIRNALYNNFKFD